MSHTKTSPLFIQRVWMKWVSMRADLLQHAKELLSVKVLWRWSPLILMTKPELVPKGKCVIGSQRAVYGVSQSWTGLKRLSSRALLRRDLAVPDVWRVSHWACAPSRGYSQPVTLCTALRLLIAIFTALLPVGMWAPLPDHWVFCCRSGSLDEIWEFLYFYWF